MLILGRAQRSAPDEEVPRLCRFAWLLGHPYCT
jgi:hypothetical protein